MSASSSLPSEIFEAILSLLPAKSLGRFKSVSKTWNSLISDPQFIKKHLQRLQTTNIILESDTKARYSLDTNQLLPYLLNINNSSSHDDDKFIPAIVKELSFLFKEVLGSCNGLVLAEDINRSIFLINPTTRDRWEVPLPPLPTPPAREFYATYYGFGYYSSTDDYKVVTISIPYQINNLLLDTCVSVYSFRKNSWKKVPNSLSYGHRLYRVKPVVVNQNVHWYTNSSTIVAFSFTTEEFSEFRLQNLDLFKGKMVNIIGLVDIGGKLGLFNRVSGDVFELWVMEDYGVYNSCKKVCCLEFGLHFGEPVCLVEGSNRDIILDVYAGDVGVFNIDEERCRNVRIEGGFGRFNVLGNYAESLESPKRFLTLNNRLESSDQVLVS